MLWSRGLVACWPLENTALDASGNGRNLTLTGSPPYVAGKLGQGLSFNGSSQYGSIGTGNGLSLTGEMTMAAWLNTNQLTNYVYALANSNGSSHNYGLAVNYPVKRFYAVWGGAVIINSTFDILANTWYHVAAVRSGSAGNWTAKLYVNGSLNATATTAVNPPGSDYWTHVGSMVTTSRVWTGPLDEVCIWNRALSAADIPRVMLGMHPLG